MAYFHAPDSQVPPEQAAFYNFYPPYPHQITAGQLAPVAPPQQPHPEQFTGLPRRRSEVDQRATSDSKPRLSKEQHDYLEHYFQQQPKPSTSTKKGFADNLGVPLDKVNNWFQNRRAKVKQEAKKAQNASLFYNSHHGQPTLPSQLGHDGFSYPNMQDATPRQSVVLNGPHAVTPDFMESLLINPSDQMRIQGEHQGMPTSVVPMQDSHGGYNSDPIQAFFGLSDPTQVDGNTDWNAVSDLGKSFVNDMELGLGMQRPRLSVTSYHTSSSSLMTGSTGSNVNSGRVSTEDTAQDCSTADPNQSSVAPSAGTTSRASMHAHHESMNQMLLPPEPQVFSFGADGLLLSGQQMLEQGALWTSQGPMAHSHEHLFINGHGEMPQVYNPHMMDDVTMHMVPQHAAQSLGTHPSGSAPFPDSNQMDYQMAQDSQNLGMIGEAEQVQLDIGREEDRQNTPQPPASGSITSNLAARRQRRPAALGISTARSASYAGTGSELSPGFSSPTSLTSDHHLRRIKSSTGAFSNRVTKREDRSTRSGYSSSQRSPLAYSFSEAAAGASMLPADLSKIGRTNSMPSVSETSEEVHSETAAMHTTIPVTVHEDEAEQANLVWANMPSTAGTATSLSVWSNMPTTADSLHSYQSPPVSPLEVINMQPFSGANMSNEPQSAPAWQTSFQLPSATESITSEGTEKQKSPWANLPSRPATAGEDTTSLSQARKGSPKAGSRSPTGSSSSGTIQGSPSVAKGKANAPHYGMFQAVTSGSRTGSRTGSPTHPALSTPERLEPKELEIHHYTPPGHEDTNELLKQKSSQPKKYDWISQGPSDFSGSPS